MIRIFLFFILLGTFAFGVEETSSSLTKQRIEVMDLKKELNIFYKEKETEYQQRKKELEGILSQIEKERNAVQKLHDKNLEILQDIKLEVKNKTSKIYNSMKPKNAAHIFNQMIREGKIEDVFDIMIKLKENNVTQIMKFLTIENASMITQKIENFSVEKQKKE